MKNLHNGFSGSINLFSFALAKNEAFYLGNGLSICVLQKKEIQLRGSFTRILIALSVFDIIFISASAALFSIR